MDPRASIGGDSDSYLEYMLKYSKYLQASESKVAKRWRVKFNNLFTGLNTHANFGKYWLDVHKDTGKIIYPYCYALSAFWPSVLTLAEQVDSAVDNFSGIMSLWQMYGGIPEIQNIGQSGANPLEGFQQYLLRPEVAESAFYLYQETKDVRYKYAGYLMLEAIENTMKTSCGYTILESVVTKEQGDKMPSYFLAETLKYLYLLFDEDHPILEGGRVFEKFVFSTEGQVFAVPQPQFSFVVHEEL